MLPKIHELIITYLKNKINEDPKLKVIFNHPNRKYSMDDIMPLILQILENGISYRNIQTTLSISWSTVYKFFRKLVKYNILEDSYNNLVAKYLANLDKIPSIQYTDTAFVCNKLGEDSISFNPQIRKHKLTKFSVINDEFGIPISTSVDTGSVSDSIVFNKQLDVLHEKHPILFNQNRIMIADAAYDSSKLRTKITELNLGILLTPINIRNTKKENIKKPTENHNMYEHLLLKTRIRTEHSICSYKKYKRINIRYDRQLKYYFNYLHLASIKIIISYAGHC